RTLGISQMPVPQDEGRPFLMVHESDILQALMEASASPTDKVATVAKELQGQVFLADSLTKVQKIFDEQNVAVVIDSGRITNVITKIDMVEFLAARN
ncbi:MAG: pyridoxal-5'-phosphate-dependent protein subunit beta, partial [Phycisphaerae bacterium]